MKFIKIEKRDGKLKKILGQDDFIWLKYTFLCPIELVT